MLRSWTGPPYASGLGPCVKIMDSSSLVLVLVLLLKSRTGPDWFSASIPVYVSRGMNLRRFEDLSFEDLRGYFARIAKLS